MITLQQRSHSPQDTGKLTGHKVKTFSQGNLLTLFCVLYVDDGTFPFETVFNSNWIYHWSTITLLSLELRCTYVVETKHQKLNASSFRHQVFSQKVIVSHEINGENMVSIRRSKQVKGGVAWEQIQTRREFIHCTHRNKTDSCGERQCRIFSSLQVLGLLDFLLTTGRSWCDLENCLY